MEVYSSFWLILLSPFPCAGEQCNNIDIYVSTKNFCAYKAINTYQQILCFSLSVNIKQENSIVYGANFMQCVCTGYYKSWILSLPSFIMDSCYLNDILTIVYKVFSQLWLALSIGHLFCTVPHHYGGHVTKPIIVVKIPCKLSWPQLISKIFSYVAIPTMLLLLGIKYFLCPWWFCLAYSCSSEISHFLCKLMFEYKNGSYLWNTLIKAV